MGKWVTGLAGMVEAACGKAWRPACGVMEKTMENQRKPPTPPGWTETGLSPAPPWLKAEWTGVDGGRREKQKGGRGERGKGAMQGTRTVLFLFQGPGQSWVEGKCVWGLA